MPNGGAAVKLGAIQSAALRVRHGNMLDELHLVAMLPRLTLEGEFWPTQIGGLDEKTLWVNDVFCTGALIQLTVVGPGQTTVHVTPPNGKRRLIESIDELDLDLDAGSDEILMRISFLAPVSGEIVGKICKKL